MAVKKIILAKPRGFCAGVERAINTVEQCLEIFGKPIYVKHEIVHNKYIVEKLEKNGAITVEKVEDIPKNSVAIFSAHGSPPKDYKKAIERGIRIIDATCPLVSRVHIQLHQYIKKGYKIVYIGHKGHPEAISVLEQFSGQIPLIENADDVKELNIEDNNIVYITQTTLSLDDTKGIINKLKNKFPHIEDPPGTSICYATTNRQSAVKEIAKKSDLFIVIGSKNSSNCNRLVETARNFGVKSYLIENLSEMNHEWLKNVEVIGLSSGASVPELLINEVIEYFTKNGAKVIESEYVKENVKFTMPKELRVIERNKNIL